MKSHYWHVASTDENGYKHCDLRVFSDNRYGRYIKSYGSHINNSCNNININYGSHNDNS